MRPPYFGPYIVFVPVFEGSVGADGLARIKKRTTRSEQMEKRPSPGLQAVLASNN